MKVFQAPIEIAGQMGLLTKGLSKLGYQVNSYNTFHTYLGYEQWIENVTAEELRSTFEKVKQDIDIFHFHYGSGFSENDDEFCYAAEHGRVALMHYWGNDVRTRSQAIEHNPYAQFIEEYMDDAAVCERLSTQSKYLSACIVQDFEVVPYVSRYYNRVYVLPIAVDVEEVEPKFFIGPMSEPPLIVHAPTSSDFKGTRYVEDVLNRLRAAGYEFRYERIERMPHEDAMRRYAKADILIDQMLCGSYGLFAVEAMSYGKPVISYIREDLKSRFPSDLPIISANPATLYSALAHLLKHSELWEDLGRRGRQYVERVHAVPVVTHALDQIYRREVVLQEVGVNAQLLPTVTDMFGYRLKSYPIDPSTGHVGFNRTLLQVSDDTEADDEYRMSNTRDSGGTDAVSNTKRERGNSVNGKQDRKASRLRKTKLTLKPTLKAKRNHSLATMNRESKLKTKPKPKLNKSGQRRKANRNS